MNTTEKIYVQRNVHCTESNYDFHQNDLEKSFFFNNEKRTLYPNQYSKKD